MRRVATNVIKMPWPAARERKGAPRNEESGYFLTCLGISTHDIGAEGRTAMKGVPNGLGGDGTCVCREQKDAAQ
jgi:hypothetical protein